MFYGSSYMALHEYNDSRKYPERNHQSVKLYEVYYLKTSQMSKAII